MQRIKDVNKLRAGYTIKRNVYDLLTYKLLKELVKKEQVHYGNVHEVIKACKKSLNNASNVAVNSKLLKQKYLTKAE